MIINNKSDFSARYFCSADGDGGGGGGGDQSSASATVGADGKATMGDAAAASAAASSASATVPFNTDPQKAAPDWREGWDGALKDNPALKDFKSAADLAKSYVETKKMVGQKINGIPGKDATPEQRAEFNKALGVPETPEGYEFKAPDGLPEALRDLYSEEDSAKWAKRMHELGVPKETANTLRNEYFKEFSEEIGKLKADISKSDEDFNKMAKETFGDKQDAEIAAARLIVEKHVPQNLKPYFNQLDNAALLTVAAAVNGVRKEYGGEDQAIKEEGGGGGRSEGELRQELRQTMSLPEYNSPFAKGKEEHERVVALAKDLSKQIENARSVKRK